MTRKQKEIRIGGLFKRKAKNGTAPKKEVSISGLFKRKPKTKKYVSVYQSKRPLSRKAKEAAKKYGPRAKAGFIAGVKWVGTHIEVAPPKKARRTKKHKTPQRRYKKCTSRR